MVFDYRIGEALNNLIEGDENFPKLYVSLYYQYFNEPGRWALNRKYVSTKKEPFLRRMYKYLILHSKKQFPEAVTIETMDFKDMEISKYIESAVNKPIEYVIDAIKEKFNHRNKVFDFYLLLCLSDMLSFRQLLIECNFYDQFTSNYDNYLFRSIFEHLSYRKTTKCTMRRIQNTLECNKFLIDATEKKKAMIENYSSANIDEINNAISMHPELSAIYGQEKFKTKTAFFAASKHLPTFYILRWMNYSVKKNNIEETISLENDIPSITIEL